MDDWDVECVREYKRWVGLCKGCDVVRDCVRDLCKRIYDIGYD